MVKDDSADETDDDRLESGTPSRPLGVTHTRRPGLGRGRGRVISDDGNRRSSAPSVSGSDLTEESASGTSEVKSKGSSGNYLCGSKDKVYSEHAMDSQGSTEINNNSKGTTAGFSKLSSIEEDSIFATVRENDEKKLDDLNYVECYDRFCNEKQLPDEIHGQRFPIENIKDEIVDHLARRQCVVIKGETGSGKTTQVPLFILEDCMKRGVACNIWVTQPRRMAAITIADHVAASREWKGDGKQVGKLIGYQVGLDRCYSRDTRILYMTAGIATNKMTMDRTQENLTHLIIDEVHERDLETEMLLLLAKDLVKKRGSKEREIKVIIMSATIDTDVYICYLNDAFADFPGQKARTIEVAGSCHPVTQKYLDDLENWDDADRNDTNDF
jgi:HrpA-like RNA helicase